MKRAIVEIDRGACTGCGLCAEVCEGGAIGMVDGKAALLDDDYCEGLGNCLPTCPAGAIHITVFHPDREGAPRNDPDNGEGEQLGLRHWPVQLALVSPHAPFLQNAHLLVVADCVAYAYAGIHKDFMRSRVTLFGCPKLDDRDYAARLTDILSRNEIKSVTVLRMEVACCAGIVNAVTKAMQNSGKVIPWQAHTISCEGDLADSIP